MKIKFKIGPSERREFIPPASEEEILHLEAVYGVRLPEDYRMFLKVINGGGIYIEGGRISDYACADIHWAEGSYHGKEELIKAGVCIHFMYSTKHEYVRDKLNCEVEFFNMEEDFHFSRPRIPKDTIEIGYDPYGNEFLLGIVGENRGKVFYWDQNGEKPEDDISEPGYFNVGFIANSFREFIDNLYIEKGKTGELIRPEEPVSKTYGLW